jgi:hypothetical protein
MLRHGVIVHHHGKGPPAFLAGLFLSHWVCRTAVLGAPSQREKEGRATQREAESVKIQKTEDSYPEVPPAMIANFCARLRLLTSRSRLSAPPLSSGPST